MKQICDQSVLTKLSKLLDNWEVIGFNLELSKTDIKGIKVDNSSEEVRRLQTLHTWKEKQGDEATYLKLVEGLLDSDTLEMVDQALNYLKESKMKCIMHV